MPMQITENCKCHIITRRNFHIVLKCSKTFSEVLCFLKKKKKKKLESYFYNFFKAFSAGFAEIYSRLLIEHYKLL